MYLELNENIIKKIKELSITNFELKGDYMPSDSIIPLIEDLLSTIDNLEEKYEDLERDMTDNYIHRPMSHYTGDSYDDRY